MTINFNDITDTATPSTGNFSVGGNAIVKGTGQNLFRNTNTFTGWGVNGGTLTLSVATTDPFGGTSVYKLVANNGESPTVGSSDILSTSSTVLSQGATYTQSVYFKAAEFSAMSIRSNTSGGIFTFTIGSTPTATGEVLTPALASVGNGWYRASWTFVAGTIGSNGRSDNWSFRLASTGDGTSGIYVSSPQLEYGSILDSYLVNTSSTPLYGTPNISFAGVSSIALDNLGNLSLQPAGTGAIQAQATTSSATGGNARGTNSVDWQTQRSAASQVTSGSSSVITGGYGNTASGTGVFIGGGLSNTSTSQYSVTAGGYNNQSTQQYASVLGGQANQATGFFNFVGGGYANSGTANGAVTTQSGTMNATTAVTLSGSNASIKVGQYITGTSIASNTYVAAISGTSLTLSQNASGSSTSTLSFYTPHGAVVAGGNNQATGSYSFIGGGGDAGTAANRNVASGNWASVLGGAKNTASGNGSVVAGGGTDGVSYYSNTSSGSVSFIGSGWNNTSSGNYSFIGAGDGNTTNGSYSSITSGRFGTTRAIIGNQVFPACSAPISTGNGTSQSALLILAKQTTDATATVLCSDGNAASGTNQVILPNNSAYYFRGEIIAGVTGAGDTKGWSIEGVIKRGANAASTALVGTPTITSNYADAGASSWSITLSADTTNGGLSVTFTGQASTTIRTVAQIRTTEMTY